LYREIPEQPKLVDISKIFTALANYTAKRETKRARQMGLIQNSIKGLNDLMNLVLENRYALMGIGVLEPMAQITHCLIDDLCSIIEAGNDEANFMLDAVKGIEIAVEETLAGHE
jgi:hypothetical protein